MLKRNSKLIAFFAIMVLFFATTFSFAENNVTTTSSDDNEITTQDSNITNEENTTSSDAKENTVQKDVYISEDNVTIDYIVEGNLFIFGKDVTVNQYVEGDVFVMGGNVTLNSEVIAGNVFACADSLTINSQLYDLYAAAKDVTIGENARIYRDAHIAASTIKMYGAVVRNADFAFDSISFESGKSTGIIYGNLTAETNVDKSALQNYVYGTLQVNPTTSNHSDSTEATSIKDVVKSALIAIVFALVMFYVLSKLLPVFTETLDKEVVSKKALGNFGYGLLSLILIPIFSIILMILILTIPLAFLILCSYIFTIAISTLIITIAIAKYIIKKYNVETTLKQLGVVALVSLVLSLIGYIPFIGVLVGFLKATITLGIVTRYILKTIFPKKAKIEIVTESIENKTEE